METKKYRVTVTRVEYFSTEVLVEAENEDLARDMAMEKADFLHCVDAEQSIENIEEVNND